MGSSKQLIEADIGDLWYSGKVGSDETMQIDYGGKSLISRQQCFWKVRAWDRSGCVSSWSPVAQLADGIAQTGRLDRQVDSPAPTLLASNAIRHASYGDLNEKREIGVTAILTKRIKDGQLKLKVNNETMCADPASNMLKALRVEYDCGGQTSVKTVAENQSFVLPDPAAVPCLRKIFEVGAQVRRAILYVSARELYEIDINGRRVGDHMLAPDWIDYRKRVRYQVYDATDLVKSGNNAISALLANGWFSTLRK